MLASERQCAGLVSGSIESAMCEGPRPLDSSWVHRGDRLLSGSGQGALLEDTVVDN